MALMNALEAEVVRMRVIWCIGAEEVAASVGVGRATVEGYWRVARVQLKRERAAQDR
ncbi:MAG: hypothetical protein KA354_17635 [Phycisphaerae bacterium]|nr:hypothetical protein [Phycisphaerae bacterium]